MVEQKKYLSHLQYLFEEDTSKPLPVLLLQLRGERFHPRHFVLEGRHHVQTGHCKKRIKQGFGFWNISKPKSCYESSRKKSKCKTYKGQTDKQTSKPKKTKTKIVSDKLTSNLMISSLPLCVARWSGENFWLSCPFGFAFPLVSNVWEMKQGWLIK